MANWDRNDEYGNRGMGGRNHTSGANAWTDGAWTADAADRLDRDVDLGGNRGSDTSPFHAGWYGPQGHGGGRDMGRGYDAGYQGGGMNRGGLGRDRGWNLGSGDAEWGHNWGSGRMGSGGAGNGYMGGGMDRGRAMGGHDQGGGWMDRAQNAVRRGWDQVENAFDRDDARPGYGARGGYGRDYGAGRGMMGGSTGGMRPGGMSRGAGWNASRGRGQYDNGYQGASGAGGIGNEPYYGNMNGNQYDRGYRGYGRGRDGY